MISTEGRSLAALFEAPSAVRGPRWYWYPLIAGVLVLAGTIAAMTPWPVGVFYDDGIYLILAKSLATGEGFRYLNLPQHPAATHYPPGYPALLAVLWKLAPDFPANTVVFKAANAVLLGVAAAGLTYFARIRLTLPAPLAVLTVVVFSLSIPMLATATVLFSEPMMLALLAPALLLSERAVYGDDRVATVMGAALLAGSVTLVRTIGIPLVGATLLMLLIRRRPASAGMYLAVVVTVLLPWQLWVAANGAEVPAIIQGSYGSYLGWFLDAFRERGLAFPVAVAAKNLGEIVRPMRALFATIPMVPTLIPLIGFAALVVLGGMRTARKAPVLGWFLVGYLVIVLLWPYSPDRFLWGIWPLVGLIIAAGGRELFERARAAGRPRWHRHAAIVVAVLAAMSIGSYTVYHVRGLSGRWWESAQRGSAESMLPLIGWTLANTSATDVLASDSDPLLHLYTGRPVVPSITWTAADYVALRGTNQQTADLGVLLATYRPRHLLLSSPSSFAAPAARTLTERRPPGLTLTNVLASGGAIFTPVNP